MTADQGLTSVRLSRRATLALALALPGTVLTTGESEAESMKQDHDSAEQEKIRFLQNAAGQLDRVAIIEIVQRERVARDMQRWAELAHCYNPDSYVDISWFKGTGAAFAAASEKMAGGGLRTFHQMGPTIVKIKRNRALTETGCAIHLLVEVDRVEVDVIGHARLYARVERQPSDWLLSGFRVVYIQDLLVPLDPTHVPKIDSAVLATYRPSYRFVSFVLARSGHPPRSDLPGLDKPAIVEALSKAEETWLNEV